MGAFREDLVQRVAGVVIELPSLAERVEDISILARRFAHRRGIEMSEESLQLLIAREWPGNVRQLRWTIARCAIFASDGEIDGRAVRAAAETGPARFHEPRPPDPAKGQIAVLTALCRRHEGEADRIAEALGVGRSTLYRRLKNAGLSLRSFKRTARAI
jgi:DNA-binding NtrC family response regulator